MMSVITISRTSYSPAKELAEKVAQQLGLECISTEVLAEASEEFHVPEIKLLRAIRDAPSILDQFTFEKEKYITYIQAALLNHFRKGNVVYHGLAGHYFVREISHVLKVRIVGNTEDRVKLVLQREEVFARAARAMERIASRRTRYPRRRRATSKAKALRILEQSDEAQNKWGLHLYGIDTNDPSLYDLMIRLEEFSIDDATNMICVAAGLDRFQTTAQSQQAMDDLVLAARVKANLIGRHPRVNVSANKGRIYIGLVGTSSREVKEIQETVGRIPGVEKIDINLHPFITPD
jgi:cytidylate kinase